jgi:CheY-like chemotaxis protein
VREAQTGLHNRDFEAYAWLIMTRPTVLVVDDDDDIRSTISALLREEGYPVRSCSTGATALEAIRALHGSPCLVLLDMKMSGMSGADVLAALRAEGRLPELPVVIISATRHASTETAGARMCLHKPIALSTLLKVVERLSPDALSSPLASCTRLSVGEGDAAVDDESRERKMLRQG